jgi:hypothetical protein
MFTISTPPNEVTDFLLQFLFAYFPFALNVWIRLKEP